MYISRLKTTCLNPGNCSFMLNALLNTLRRQSLKEKTLHHDETCQLKTRKQVSNRKKIKDKRFKKLVTPLT